MSKKLPVCCCFQVYEEEIRQIISDHSVRSVEELQMHCQAGMGCGSCRTDLELIIGKEKTKTGSSVRKVNQKKG